MSTTHNHSSHPPTSNAELSGDPTNTGGIRNDFLRDVRRRFRRLRGMVRRTVGYENDALQLKTTANASAQDTFDFNTDSGRTQAFNKWFRQALQEDILEPVRVPGEGGHWTASYVRSGYEKGWMNAEGRLMQEGVALGGVATQDVFDLPIPQSQLQSLYTRAYSNLDDITEEMSTQISRELTSGLAEGRNPRDMARSLTEEITDIQRRRAETLARTEVINSYSTATLDRYEQAGVGTVTIKAEWSTAGDRRVCPICMSLEGRVMTTAEARNGTFDFTPDEGQPSHLAGSYQIRPPAHPNCRCALLPVT